jgi:hypothetical protein
LKEAFAVLLFLDHVIDLVVEIWRMREKETSGLGEDPDPFYSPFSPLAQI